jgi:carbamoyltransferase
MKVLGYNGGLDGYPSSFDTGHDAAATLVVDGKVVAACEEERFSRFKHDARFPRHAIEYVMREGGVKSLDELDLITFYFSYPLMFHPGKYTSVAKHTRLLDKPAIWIPNTAMKLFNKFAGYDNNRSHRAFEREMGVKVPHEKFKAVPHHLCHVASTFYDSPFERALCVTLDAEGESVSGMMAVANGTDIKVLRQTYAPNSLGYLYSFVSLFLGFDKHDEYKVMGLAPYGKPDAYRDYFKSIVTLHDDGGFTVDPGLITLLMARDAMIGRDSQTLYPPSMVKALGPARKKDEVCTQKHMDIAASLQECLEETVMHLLRHLQRETGEKNLCMAGGVALNCTMNGKIARSGLFDSIWIHPAAHDSGTSLGAALYGYHNLLRQPRVLQKHQVYLGPAHPRSEVDRALEEFGAKIKHSKPDNLYDSVAAALEKGKVVGWYQGRMEWGPRALGNRSILADARRDDMKDVVNHAVKLREGFRPFAPACLAEDVNEWFDMKGLKDSPYMLFVVPVQADKRDKIPAVTHVDGSARVQTVTAEQNPKFHKLLQAFKKRTGVPVFMNTSFNVKGEPIVNTPQDAVRCFLNTQIDMLVLDDVVIEKRPEVAEALAKERSREKARTGRVIDGQIAL